MQLTKTRRFAVFTTGATDGETALSALNKRIVAAEARVAALEALTNDPVERVKRDLSRRKVYSSTFVQVASNYYDRPLPERALCLKCTVPQMCKSIIFENTAWIEDVKGDRTNAQYYLVVVQYQAKLDTELLVDLVYSLRPPETRLPRKRFHFRLAPEAVSDRLSGFIHNGVTPFGMLHDVPIVICRNCLDVQPAYLFMGGGKVDIKLGISAADFVRSTDAIVGKLSSLRANFASDED